MCGKPVLHDIVTFVFKKGRTAGSFFGRNSCRYVLTPKYSTNQNRLASSAVLSNNKRPSVLISAFLPRAGLSRSYQRGNSPVSNKGGVWRSRLWTIVRGVLLTTGTICWLVVFFAYMALDKVSVDVREERKGPDLKGLEKKMIDRFYQENNVAGVIKKDNALDLIWNKLNQEERVREIFGYPVYICGYNYGDKIKDLFHEVEESTDKKLLSKDVDFREERTSESFERETESEEDEAEDDTWEAGCYIEGPKKVGLLKVKFEKQKQEWIPVALQLETLEKSGQVVSDVSAPLPNGIKNFTRLSN